MYIVREIFHLKFGQFKDAKALFQEALQKNLLPNVKNMRVLSDFTGESYRLILESSHETLDDFEKSLKMELDMAEWQSWYTKFKAIVKSSQREILKQVI